MKRLSLGKDQYNGIYNIQNGWYMALAQAMVDQAKEDVRDFPEAEMEHKTAKHFLGAPKIRNLSQIMVAC